MHRCHLCSKTFKAKYVVWFSNHLLNHHKEKSWACSQCSKTFASQKWLDKHRDGHGKFSCYHCLQRKSDPSELCSSCVIALFPIVVLKPLDQSLERGQADVPGEKNLEGIEANDKTREVLESADNQKEGQVSMSQLAEIGRAHV